MQDHQIIEDRYDRGSVTLQIPTATSKHSSLTRAYEPKKIAYDVDAHVA